MTLPDATSRDAYAGDRGREHDFFPGATLEEKPIWLGLYEGLRDAMLPPHLPPLELTSKPIPVQDRMASRTNPWAVGSATMINGGILALVILLGMRAAINYYPPSNTGDHFDISELHVFAPPAPIPSSGGNGGGTHDLIDPIEGRNPKFSSAPVAPPMVPLIEQPRLPVDSAIDIRLPDASSLPNLGVQHSPNVTLNSDGSGTHGGMGTGNHGGVGPGNGNSGLGPGSGDRIYNPGGAVSAPVPIYAPEAEFSDEARRSKYMGVCMVSLIVDAQGNPQSPHVVRALGMGLDEKALEAIRRYKFKPAMKAGKPVASIITIEVDFHLY